MLSKYETKKLNVQCLEMEVYGLFEVYSRQIIGTILNWGAIEIENLN